MLKDDRLREINDYLSAADVFPGVGLKGGVCYFLWERDNPGQCRVTTHFKDWPVSTATRPLLEEGADVFIRFNEGLSILKKVIAVETGQTKSLSLPENKRFDRLVSSRKPFGLETKFKGKATKRAGDVLVYQNGGTGYTPRNSITTGTDLIDKWKLFAGYAAPGTGNKDTYPHRIISTPFIGEPGSISSETYLCIGPFDSKSEAESVLSYLSCRLTRLLILLHKPSQDTSRKVYTFVPTQDWTKQWTDADLYAKYGLTKPRNCVHRENCSPDGSQRRADEVAVDEATMSKPIEEILAPKPEARPRIYAYSIADAAHEGLLKVGQTTRDVKQRVAEQLKTASIKNYRIELDESAERDDGTIVQRPRGARCSSEKGFENTDLEWMRCTVKDVQTVLTELRTGQKLTGTHHETFPMRARAGRGGRTRPSPTSKASGPRTRTPCRASCGTPRCASARPSPPTSLRRSWAPSACWSSPSSPPWKMPGRRIWKPTRTSTAGNTCPATPAATRRKIATRSRWSISARFRICWAATRRATSRPRTNGCTR